MVNILIIAQRGRLQNEALVFLASYAKFHEDGENQVYVAEPQAGPLWEEDPTIEPDHKAMMERLGAKILPLDSKVFGTEYPYGNKIEALRLLPEGEPFVFFDTDTLFTGSLRDVPFDFDKPAASGKVLGTWPTPDLYGPEPSEIWKSLYDRFELDFESSLDTTQPDEYWRRFLYFNAGFFYYKCPKVFGDLFMEYAQEIRDNPPPEVEGQVMDPWLDQVALPLVIHKLGGGRGQPAADALDGSVTCHYRMMPLLYAQEPQATIDVLEEVCAPNKIKKLVKQHEAFRRFIFQGRGMKLRGTIKPDDLLRNAADFRKMIKNRGFWMR